MPIEFFVIFSIAQIYIGLQSIINIGIRNKTTVKKDSVKAMIDMTTDSSLDMITKFASGVAICLYIFYAVVYVTLAFSTSWHWAWTALALYSAATHLVSIVMFLNKDIDLRKDPTPATPFVRGLVISRYIASILFLIHWLAVVPFGGM